MRIQRGKHSRGWARCVTVLIGPLIMITSLVFGPAIVQAGEGWQTKALPADVENGVICILDGCMMNLSVCDTPAAQQLRLIIREKMFRESWNKEQTYSYLAGVYGDKVLAAPPRRGFNWVVWLGPFVATIAGGALIYLGLDKWVSAGKIDEEELEELPALTSEQTRMLEQELKKYL